MSGPEPPGGPPGAACTPLVEVVRADTRLWRIHRVEHAGSDGHADDDGTVFNPGIGAPTRFAPMTGHAGATVPTLYAGASRRGALFESVLHDQMPLSVVDSADWTRHRLTALRLTVDLQVVALHGAGLRSLGLFAADVTHTFPSHYARTTRWAAWLHAHTDAAGLSWTSHQDDDERAYVLWGDRVPAGALVPDPTIAALPLGSDDGHDWLVDVAASARIEVI